MNNKFELKTAGKDVPESYFLITDHNQKKVFEIKQNGSVFYQNNKGKIVKARTDKQLGRALGKALTFFIKANELQVKKEGTRNEITV